MEKRQILGLGILLIAAACGPLAAQQTPANWCTQPGWNSDNMVSHSEIREERLAPGSAETLVNPQQNGSIRLHGWANADILVRACVQSSARDIASAEVIAKQVAITDGPGRVVAKGPEAQDHAWWSVSYEIWAPASASIELEANNGSIHIEGTTGRVRAHTLNGSLRLKDVQGEIEGETTNGSLLVELTGTALQGAGMRLKTVNGSVHLQLPASFGAEIEASTVNGKLKSDFGDLPADEERHNVDFTIGGGGPKIEADTVNGSVQISRQG
jgi:hypothetical protein